MANEKKDGKEVPAKHYEDAVHQAWGVYGRYQIGINFLLSLATIPVGWQVLAMNFLAPKSDFWCSQPEQSLAFWGENDWRDFSRTQAANGTLDRCHVYDLDYSNQSMLDAFTPSENETVSRSCTDFTYDTSTWTSTVIQKFDLVCARAAWVSYSNSIFMSGVAVGVSTSGIASDKFGRKPTIIVLLLLAIVSGFSAAFVTSFPLWLALRWVTVGSSMSVHTVQFVLRMEMLSGRAKVTVSSGFTLLYALGTITLPLLAMLVYDSNKMEMIMSLAYIPVLLAFYFVPESPRWLIGKRRFEQAKAVLEKGARINRREVPKEWSFETKSLTEGKQRAVTVLTLFRTPTLRLYCLGMYLLWFAHGFVYYGIAMNVGNIGGDLFVNSFIFGSLDIPATIVLSLGFLYIRRRPFMAGCMLACGVGLLATMAFDKGQFKGDWPIITLAMTAKLFMTCSFIGLYTYSAEVFPTMVRNLGIGSSSMCARFGSILAPLTFSLSSVNAKFFPTGLLGLVFLLCSCGLLLLPETLNAALPRTVEELEERRKGKKEALTVNSKEDGAEMQNLM